MAAAMPSLFPNHASSLAQDHPPTTKPTQTQACSVFNAYMTKTTHPYIR